MKQQNIVIESRPLAMLSEAAVHLAIANGKRNMGILFKKLTKKFQMPLL